MYNISTESVSKCREELEKISQRNWDETARYNTGFVGVDWGLLQKLEELNAVRFYVARDPKQVIVGYAMFIVNPMINRAGNLVANNNVIYILPELRGQGVGDRLIKYAETSLKEDDVSIVGIPLKKESPLMERNGYVLDEFNYTKQIG